jgi:Domain of unknown function (DUF1841)
MVSPTRSQARDFFFSAWANYRAGLPLTDLERVAVEIIALHPEYHALLEARDRHVDRDYTPEQGQANPFLHLGLHLGIAEQLATDRPNGIRGEFDRLVKRHGDEHSALHDVLECLGETMWQAQRSSVPPDTEAYLECLRRK